MMRNSSQRGSALLIAIMAAIILSITAGVILNLNYQRFFMTKAQADNVMAQRAAEAALTYGFMRLEDPVFRQLVINKYTTTGGNSLTPEDLNARTLKQEYVVVSVPLPVPPSTPPLPGLGPGDTLDWGESKMQMGTVYGAAAGRSRHVTLRILYLQASSPINTTSEDRFRVRAFTSYGEVGARGV